MLSSAFTVTTSAVAPKLSLWVALLVSMEYKIKDSLVNCKSQAEFAKQIMPSLTETELSVYKRGRNAAPKCTPKNGSVADYHSATGLEALFGYLHLNGEKDRVDELFSMIIHMESLNKSH